MTLPSRCLLPQIHTQNLLTKDLKQGDRFPPPARSEIKARQGCIHANWNARPDLGRNGESSEYGLRQDGGFEVSFRECLGIKRTFQLVPP